MIIEDLKQDLQNLLRKFKEVELENEHLKDWLNSSKMLIDELNEATTKLTHDVEAKQNEVDDLKE